MKHEEITEKIIGAAYAVYNCFGFGFLEKVYENALAVEMRKKGMHLEQQFPITVTYDDNVVGEYVADFLVEDEVLVEIKAVRKLENIHHSQVIHYLKATCKEVGLLINFGSELEIKRKVVTKS